VKITDYPRFGWRGLLVDPARHFIPKADMLRYLDAMAMHKLNRLQIHLTDNEGWRIEIKKYPKLTTVGSTRDRSGSGPGHGGFYSQADMREIVKYAAARHITIIPEIEMPAHTGAASLAYPDELALKPKRNGHVLAPRPAAVAFMQNVLTEIMEIFPGRHIHIGGDEANTGVWQKNAEMQEQMRRMGHANVHELHSWFIKQMDAFLTRHGRRLVGWDEILQGGLAEGATVMSWRGTRGGIAAAKAGHDVVMAPTSHTYFDYRQAPKELGLGRSIITVEKVYAFEPIPSELSAKEARHVLGGQGQLWGELIKDRERREFMTWPRACALAEVLWSPKTNRDVDLFLTRLWDHLERLKAAAVNYRALDAKPQSRQGVYDANAPRAAAALAGRILPQHADRFVFETLRPDRGRDVFEIESRDGRTVIRGNTAVSMATGLNWYLKHYCHCHVSLRGNQLELPDQLPEVRPKLRKTSWAQYRYFLNYCCFGYSLPWWNWSQWEQLIDFMALNGVNAPLAVTGQEATWRAVCRRLGMTDQQIKSFLAGPPYLPFQWMGCLDGWGGPLPDSWIDQHENLGSKILARQRQLGMTPILQGFTGHVPPAVAEQYPEAQLHTIHWIEWKTHLLDPLDPLFAKIAGLFMEEQTKRFGTDHLYAADTFIEMVPPRGEPEYLASLSRAIHDGMAKTDPKALWVLQGWAFMFKRSFWTQPRIRAFLDAVPNERMLVLDLYCESKPMWNQTEAFCGKPWAWCNIQNFGNTVFLGGALKGLNRNLDAARTHPQRGALRGLGFVNEGLGFNPVVHDLMFELAWRNGPVDLDAWLTGYARHRYGRESAAAERAWRILAETVYAAQNRTRSIIDCAPTMKPRIAAPYDNVRLAEAWRLLLEAAGDLAPADTYRYDLVNVARQALSNHAANLHREAVTAFRKKDAPAFAAASSRFLGLIGDLDELLATRGEFQLGRWLEDAKRWGATDEEKARFEWNARRVLTLWGEGPRIDDYARKEWAGMLRGYYLPRWRKFVVEAGECLKANKPFDAKAFGDKLRPWMAAWSDARDVYATRTSGDSVAVAGKLWKKYGGAFQPEAPSLTTGKPSTCSHALPPYPARLANDGHRGDTDKYWATDIGQHPGPAWWQVDLQKPTIVGRVVVVGYYGDNRNYGFTVEASLDGKKWETVADMRDNKAPSTAKGYTCRFTPRPVRFLRVTQTHNSANPGRHLVEVMAFEK
jgi:alpha-N-acetylglucosaminidase